jgi:hypothetical protein
VADGTDWSHWRWLTALVAGGLLAAWFLGLGLIRALWILAFDSGAALDSQELALALFPGLPAIGLFIVMFKQAGRPGGVAPANWMQRPAVFGLTIVLALALAACSLWNLGGGPMAVTPAADLATLAGSLLVLQFALPHGTSKAPQPT